MFDVRCSIFDVRCSMFDLRFSIFDFRFDLFSPAPSHRHLKPHRPHHAPPRPRLENLKTSARHHQPTHHPFPNLPAPPRPHRPHPNPNNHHHNPTAQPRQLPLRINIALHWYSIAVLDSGPRERLQRGLERAVFYLMVAIFHFITMVSAGFFYDANSLSQPLVTLISAGQ
jgi:hypothetical protein